MAHITEFKIEGLLGRDEEIHFILNRDINVFFGENGCGKTTLLKALHYALARNSNEMASLPITRAEVSIFSVNRDQIIKHTWSRKGKKFTSSPVKVSDSVVNEQTKVQNTNSSDGDGTWKLIPEIDKAHNITTWNHEFLPTSRLFYDSTQPNVPAGAPLTESQFDNIFSASIKSAWLKINSSILAEVGKIQEKGLGKVLKNVLTPPKSVPEINIANPAEAYDRVKRFLARQNDLKSIELGSLEDFIERYNSDVEARRIIENLESIEREIEEAMTPLNKFSASISDLFSNGKKISFSAESPMAFLANGLEIPITKLSSGEKQLIKILLSSIRADVNSIIIDEPELSMHIDWQRSLIERMLGLNPSCQIIIATHSPEIMANIEDKCIFKI